jgi:hypothetical protein
MMLSQSARISTNVLTTGPERAYSALSLANKLSEGNQMSQSTTQGAPFRVAFLPVNQAWCLTWGDSIIAVNVGAVEQRLFDSRAELVSALDARGLAVSDANHVVVKS